MFPFAPVILTINPSYYDSTTGLYIGLLGFLKLVRFASAVSPITGSPILYKLFVEWFTPAVAAR